MDKCPQCGYSDIAIPTSVTFTATEYINEKTGKKSVLASNQETVAANDGIWIRADLYNSDSERSKTILKQVEADHTGLVTTGNVTIKDASEKPSDKPVPPAPKPVVTTGEQFPAGPSAEKAAPKKELEHAKK